MFLVNQKIEKYYIFNFLFNNCFFLKFLIFGLKKIETGEFHFY